MKRFFLLCVIALATTNTVAQAPGPYTLWHIYLSAGATAVKEKNWPEAEALFSAAVNQAEQAQSKEPFLVIAKYSLATAYWEEGQKDAAKQVFTSLKPTSNWAGIGAELHQSSSILSALGSEFYEEAESDRKDANDKKLKDQALKDKEDDAEWKYLFARKYYGWAFVIEKSFLSPHSPELKDIAAVLSLAQYKAGEYADAIESFKELQAIVETSTRRSDALSHGSLKYSLAPGGPANKSKDSLSVAAISKWIGLGYEGLAGDASDKKPAEAAQDYAQAELSLQKYVHDTDQGSDVRSILARVYEEHAQLLRKLNQNPQAEILERKAKLVRSMKS